MIPDFLMFLLFFGFIPLIVVGIILSARRARHTRRYGTNRSPRRRRYAGVERKPDSKSSYEKLLDSEEWRQKRLSILKRDCYRCRYCGNRYNLQVHHKYYKKYPDGQKVKPWNYPDDALITLCVECHKKVHSKKKIKTYKAK